MPHDIKMLGWGKHDYKKINEVIELQNSAKIFKINYHWDFSTEIRKKISAKFWKEWSVIQ